MTLMELLTWNTWVHSVVGGAHFAAALIALVLGPLIFLRRKGTGWHRGVGYVFVLAMLTVNITALTLYDLTGGPNLFHFFALLSLTALLPGFYAIQRFGRTGEASWLQLHVRLMIWAYFGLAGAGFAQLAPRYISSLTRDWSTTFWIIGGTVAVVGLIMGGIVRLLVPRLAARYLEDPIPPARE